MKSHGNLKENLNFSQDPEITSSKIRFLKKNLKIFEIFISFSLYDFDKIKVQNLISTKDIFVSTKR